MKYDINGVERRRHVIVALRERARQALMNAVSVEWPYTHLQPQVRVFASRLLKTADQLLIQAAHELAFLSEETLGRPVDETQLASVSNRLELSAGEASIPVEAVHEAVDHFVEAISTQAQSLIIRAEACLEGEQTLDGREIQHGDLYYK